MTIGAVRIEIDSNYINRWHKLGIDRMNKLP